MSDVKQLDCFEIEILRYLKKNRRDNEGWVSGFTKEFKEKLKEWGERYPIEDFDAKIDKLRVEGKIEVKKSVANADVGGEDMSVSWEEYKILLEGEKYLMKMEKYCR